MLMNDDMINTILKMNKTLVNSKVQWQIYEYTRTKVVYFYGGGGRLDTAELLLFSACLADCFCFNFNGGLAVKFG
ncbi:hypothetical protein AO372_1451 [Moraxella catarrhalis]|nr:hypothetical protein AO375_0722 [Moraxella catarrhalis]OAV20393.1 hypothetical protein AO372_1451 [Moraxella catarrhalis]